MYLFLALRRQFSRWSKTVDARNRFVREDFADGARTLVSYINTHRMKYQRHVGAHFIVALHAKGEEAFAEFVARQQIYGWHFPLNEAERAAMTEARDKTCAHVKVANMRYARNVWGQLANSKQLVRAIGLGAVASTAVIAVTLTEFVLFARHAVKSLAERLFGVTILENTSPEEAAAFVELAQDITAEAALPDGTLDADVVAERIADLVDAIEASASVETAVNVTSGDYTYLIGVISGILLLVIGRGLARLIAEGFSGAVSKIDAFVHDMDDYCEYVLGRSPFPPADADYVLLGKDVQAAQAARNNDSPRRALPVDVPAMDYAPGVRARLDLEDETDP